MEITSKSYIFQRLKENEETYFALASFDKDSHHSKICDCKMMVAVSRMEQVKIREQGYSKEYEGFQVHQMVIDDMLNELQLLGCMGAVEKFRQKGYWT